MRIGVEQCVFAQKDPHMALPKHEITPLPRAGCFAESRFLEIAIPWAGSPSRLERELHEARAIHALMGIAAPKLAHAEKPLGLGHPVRRRVPQGGELLGAHPPAARKPAPEPVRLSAQAEPRPVGKRHELP